MKKIINICMVIMVSTLATIVNANEKSHESSELFHQHNIGLFIGQTHFEETEFSIGLEYEYRFNPKWGAGLIYERTNDAHHGDGEDVKLASLYYHFFEELRLGVGFGVEEIGGQNPLSEDLIRVSLSYDFHFNDNISFAPYVAIDRVGDENLEVYGVSIVFGF